MPYTYPIDAQAMFDDRTHQFLGFGLPADDIAEVRAATTDFWADRPGGWPFEFSRLAARYADEGRHLLASLAYGCAKFPCLADAARETALARQLEQYLLAAPTFPVRFERRQLELTVGTGNVTVPVHLFSTADQIEETPVVLFSGGVDTWKMDVHSWCITLAEHTGGATVMAFDMPGTGETPVLLGGDSDTVVQALVSAARSIGDGLVGHLGISFGGNFSAMTGLTGSVDAAVVLGGSVDGGFRRENLRQLPYGMADIVGNAMGFDHPVTVDELSAASAPLNRTALLKTRNNAPMLVINGADDYFVPQQDTLVFRGRPGVTVDLIDGTGHCAMSEAGRVLPVMISWLRTQLAIPTPPPAAPPASDDQKASEVLVVGAGPVGLVMACELARRQVPVRLIDKLAAPTVESRAILIHSRSLEMLDRIGVVDQIIASGVRTGGMQLHADGKTLADLPFDDVDSPYPYSITTAQTETERILTARLHELGGDVERGVELVSFDQDDTGVRYTVRHADGTTESAVSGWIIGTDGSRSTVRAQTGQQLQGSFKGERFLLGDVDADHHLSRDRMHSFFGAGGGPLLIFPMLGRRVRVVAQITDRDDTATLDRLQSVIDERTTDFRLLSARWLTVFEIHHAQVPQYRCGRAFVAGDAAHVHSPAGGQGMNTGMQDAFNLGWKLAAVVRDDADPVLLDSYHAERHPVAARVIEQTTKMTTMGTLDHRVARTVRNTALHLAGRISHVRRVVAEQLEETGLAYPDSPIVSGNRRGRGIRAGDNAPGVAGTILHEQLTATTGTVALLFGLTFDGALGAVNGLRQLRIVTGRPAGEPRERVGDHRADVTILDDPDGRIARRYRAQSGDVVLVRPDGYAGFVGRSGDPDFGPAVALYRSAAGCATAPTLADAGRTATGSTLR